MASAVGPPPGTSRVARDQGVEPGAQVRAQVGPVVEAAADFGDNQFVIGGRKPYVFP